MTTVHIQADHLHAHTWRKTCITLKLAATFQILCVLVTYLQTQILQGHNISGYTAVYLHKLI
jgi:hypothetical protein